MAVFSLFTLAITPILAYAQSCPSSVLSTWYQTPSVAPGYSFQLISNNITNPRHIVFDTAGNLLIAGDPAGIIALVLDEVYDNGCITVQEQKVVVENGDLGLEHGLSLSADGKTLYASSVEAAYSWSYNSSTLTTSNQRTLVNGMTSRGHITRTLLASKSYPDFLIISRGSGVNIDYDTENLASGKSMIKAFNVSSINEAPYNYTNDGVLLGWGLRDSVGVGEDQFGGLWSVENSADQIMRYRIDIHTNNPAEELNWHGYLNQTVGQDGYVGRNYGYPYCYTAWEPNYIPSFSNFTTGDQFTPLQNLTFADQQCRDDFQGPEISLQAHTAPLDIKFHPKTGDAWVSFHGSWDRDPPVGYKLSVIPFNNKPKPRPTLNSTRAAVDIMWNPDLTECPKRCFEPVGVAFDEYGRVWMSSDESGEIYMVTPPEWYGNGTVRVDEPEDSQSSGASLAMLPLSASSLIFTGGLAMGVGAALWL